MTDEQQELFNERHLLWWILKAVHACRADGTRPDTLLSETMWKNLGAPDWVLPAMREKYAQMPQVYRPAEGSPQGGKE